MKKYPFWLKGSVIVTGVTFLFILLANGKFILMPLAFAALLAMLLEPVSRWFERLKIGRAGGIVLSMLLAFILLAGVFSLLSIQLVQFLNDLPEAQERLQSISGELLTFFQQTFGISPDQQVNFLQQGLQTVIDKSGQYLSTAVSATTNVFTTVAILPFFIFFMIYYKDRYRTFLQKVWKTENTRKIDAMVSDVQSVAQHYIVGMLMVISILALLNGIGLWILGLEHAVFFAVFAAVLAIIPYIGIIIGSLPAILYAVLFTDSLLVPGGVVAVFAGVQFLEGNFITPNIIGSRVSINPFMALVALIIGGELWGISGMILFVPFLGILRCVFDEIEELRPYGYLFGSKAEYEVENVTEEQRE